MKTHAKGIVCIVSDITNYAQRKSSSYYHLITIIIKKSANFPSCYQSSTWIWVPILNVNFSIREFQLMLCCHDVFCFKTENPLLLIYQPLIKKWNSYYYNSFLVISGFIFKWYSLEVTRWGGNKCLEWKIQKISYVFRAPEEFLKARQLWTKPYISP